MKASPLLPLIVALSPLWGISRRERQKYFLPWKGKNSFSNISETKRQWQLQKSRKSITTLRKWVQEHVDLSALEWPSQEIFVGCTSFGLDSYLPSETSHAQLWCNHKISSMSSVHLMYSFSSQEPRVPPYSVWLVPKHPHEASSFIDEITGSLSLNVKWLIVMILTQHIVLFFTLFWVSQTKDIFYLSHYYF